MHIAQPFVWCHAMTESNISCVQPGVKTSNVLWVLPPLKMFLKWSDDNLLAVSFERGVIILSPCNLSSTRHFAVAEELEIMYMLDAIDEYGSFLYLLLQDHKVSAAETEDLLHECCEMMPRVSESQEPRAPGQEPRAIIISN